MAFANSEAARLNMETTTYLFRAPVEVRASHLVRSFRDVRRGGNVLQLLPLRFEQVPLMRIAENEARLQGMPLRDYLVLAPAAVRARHVVQTVAEQGVGNYSLVLRESPAPSARVAMTAGEQYIYTEEHIDPAPSARTPEDEEILPNEEFWRMVNRAAAQLGIPVQEYIDMRPQIPESDSEAASVGESDSQATTLRPGDDNSDVDMIENGNSDVDMIENGMRDLTLNDDEQGGTEGTPCRSQLGSTLHGANIPAHAGLGAVVPIPEAAVRFADGVVEGPEHYYIGDDSDGETVAPLTAITDVPDEPPAHRRRLVSPRPSPAHFAIYVKALDGSTVTLWVTHSTTIEQVKEMLLTKLGWFFSTWRDLRLNFGKTQLEHGRTMSDYNISEASTLDMMRRFRGGAGLRGGSDIASMDGIRM
jgi:hypothetical protein